MTALRDKSFFLQERNILSLTKNMKEVRFILEIAQFLMYLKILNLELMIQKIKRNYFFKNEVHLWPQNSKRFELNVFKNNIGQDDFIQINQENSNPKRKT